MSFYSRFKRMSSAASATPGASSSDHIVPLIEERGIHQTIGDYYVTSLYPSRDITLSNVLISTPSAQRSLARAASVLSGVPTHGLQGTRYGAEEHAYHVVTKITPGSNSGLATHALNTATLHSLMFPEHSDMKLVGNTAIEKHNSLKGLLLQNSIGKGYLENITAINDKIKPFVKNATPGHEGEAPFQDNAEKGMAYLSSFTGLMSMYGTNHGYDFGFIRETIQGVHNSYTVSSLERKITPSIGTLKDTFGIARSDQGIYQLAMRTYNSAMDNQYANIHSSQGTGNTPRPGDINSFGFSNNNVDQYLNHLTATNPGLSAIVSGAYDNTIFNTSTPRLTPVSSTNPVSPTPTTAPVTPAPAATTPSVQTTPPETHQAASTTSTSEPNWNSVDDDGEIFNAQQAGVEVNPNSSIAGTRSTGAAPFDPLRILTTPGSNVQDALNNNTAHTTSSITENPPTPHITDVSAMLESIGSGRYGTTVVNAYNNTDTTPAPTRTSTYTNPGMIEVMPDSTFKTFEQRYSTGGGSVTPATPGNLTATSRTIEALGAMRERLDASAGLADDRKFYQNIGHGSVPANEYRIMDVDHNNMTPETKKMLSFGGALVGKNADGTYKWMVDDMVQHQINKTAPPTSVVQRGRTVSLSPISDGGENASYTSHNYPTNSFNVADSPTPEMDLNPEHMQLMNTSLSMREALGNGYVIPVAQNKAIFAPSFTNLNHTFGAEFETPGVFKSATEIASHIKDKYGYDINKMGFEGSLHKDDEPSLHGDGTEYVTAKMQGIRGVKALYHIGEALRDLGGRAEGGNYGATRGPNDPPGIHINVGAVPESGRQDVLKFGADYFRLFENVIKSTTSSPERYGYTLQGSTSDYLYGAAIQPESLSSGARTHAANSGQCWSQNMSQERIVGAEHNNGVETNMYSFYRENGSFWGDLSNLSNQSGHIETSGLQKLAKYTTGGLHKVQTHGVLEMRHAQYIPGGAHPVAQLAFATKIMSDLVQGASSGDTGNVALTDTLIPPTNGWNERTKGTFNEILGSCLGIKDATSQNFAFDYYRRCKHRDTYDY